MMKLNGIVSTQAGSKGIAVRFDLNTGKYTIKNRKTGANVVGDIAGYVTPEQMFDLDKFVGSNIAKIGDSGQTDANKKTALRWSAKTRLEQAIKAQSAIAAKPAVK